MKWKKEVRLRLNFCDPCSYQRLELSRIVLWRSNLSVPAGRKKGLALQTTKGDGLGLSGDIFFCVCDMAHVYWDITPSVFSPIAPSLFSEQHFLAASILWSDTKRATVSRLAALTQYGACHVMTSWTMEHAGIHESHVMQMVDRGKVWREKIRLQEKRFALHGTDICYSCAILQIWNRGSLRDVKETLGLHDEDVTIFTFSPKCPLRTFIMICNGPTPHPTIHNPYSPPTTPTTPFFSPSFNLTSIFVNARRHQFRHGLAAFGGRPTQI